ncbi:Murein L,D-transpeptidase YcbB/YkuD [Cognatiyoonia sediminum]|uniref:Murein L,D-transpeptidase YcbB/YkuD n=2 Tax=Cognatiyoonia sediminum TaxID=1508389 RepID=A0A1M5M0C3_9RHOB|nr:Murein L,D-transpeptidase YcbB/YkuD [Cognatiyoonia sediminum]
MGMMFVHWRFFDLNLRILAPAIVAVSLILPTAIAAQVTAFRQAVAEAAARDDDLAAFYRDRNFEGIWTGSDEQAQERRNTFLTVLDGTDAHGLPPERYNTSNVMAMLREARTPEQQGKVEVELSRLLLQYARDVQSGILVPGNVDELIKREVAYRDRLETIEEFAAANAGTFLRALPPSSPEYSRLMREKIELEAGLLNGGWGPRVNGRKLELGDSGQAVVALRNRLISMGYLPRTASQTYDEALEMAVRKFQEMHGLEVDGTAGEGTLEQINVSMERRLQSVLVAMERERWINHEKGDRHIWVNLTDFTARIVDNDVVTFQTRSVIGANDADRQSPEFSDVMEFMVINPSWYVPRSIMTKEYLPQLQRNPNAVRHLEITDRRGRVVNRANVDFTQFTRRNFPFSMRQPPSRSNALGLVKFMFPNQYNIYLHDTPAKNLFSRETRAYSHGCIRLNDPFDFAYELLALQEVDPEGFFQAKLGTGRENRVDLEQPVPVHLVYRTAFTDALGNLQFRRDVYGRDARVWQALAREGVAISAVQG